MKRLPTLLLLLFASCAFNELLASAYVNACDCLAANIHSSEDAAKMRIYTYEASFNVPHGASACKMDSPDTESWRWVLGRHTSGYTRMRHSRMPNGTDERWCELERSFGNVVLNLDQDEPSISAYFADERGEARGIHAIYIIAETIENACKWMNLSLNSFSFINDLNRMQVLHIDEDASYFVYENEFGLKQVATVGDYVTRDSGHVIEISVDHVVLQELVRKSDIPGMRSRVNRVKYLYEKGAEKVKAEGE